jgi:hypothetical protein
MKTKLNVEKLRQLLILLLTIIIISCAKEEQVILPESNLILKNGMKLPTEDVVCDLIAGQNILVGQVIYSNDGTNLYVTYLVNSPWVLTELHFYAGSLAGLPRNKTAILIGQFPYDMGDLVGNTLTIPLEGLSFDSNGYTLSAHAVVVNGLQNETAWANCTAKTYKPVISLKTRFSDYTYAVSDGAISYANYFTNNSTEDHWCHTLGLNVYENGDEYILQSRHHDYLGKVLVSDDGTNLSVTVLGDYLNENLIHSYLFVGTLEEFGKITLFNDCPAYETFPYINNAIGSNTHNFLIKIPKEYKSITFNEAFGSNRWGWFSYY